MRPSESGFRPGRPVRSGLLSHSSILWPMRKRHTRTFAYDTGVTGSLQPVDGAPDALAALVQDAGLGYRRLHALVSQKLVHRPDIMAIVERVPARSKARVRLDGFRRVLAALLPALVSSLPS